MKNKLFCILCVLLTVPIVFVSSVSAASSARSDTTENFTITPGKAYTFKITSRGKPSLVAGSKSFRYVSTRQSGDNYFMKFIAVGQSGDGCGFYLNGAKRPVAIANIVLKKSQSATKAFTTIQTDTFTVKVPSDWETSTRPEIVFGKEHYDFGGVSEISYDAAQPVSQFYGNHAEEISKKEIKTLSLPATEVVLRRSSPAASGQPSSDELHYYFVHKDGGVAYDLSFNPAFVDHDTAEKIAQSFKVK